MSNTISHAEMKKPGQNVDTPSNSITAGEIIIGTIQSINDAGQALVNFSGNLNNDPIPAISTVSVTQQLSGRQVALLFAEGNLNNPVIMGIIHNPLNDMLENFELSKQAEQQTTELPTVKNSGSTTIVEDVLIDGKRLVIEGEEEIVFKCGESSITLTRSGKILIRGKYLLNRSTGVNRIMGGSVQVN